MRMHNFDMESQSLEKRYSVFTTDLLENDGEFVVGDFINKVTLELDNDVVSGEDGAEGVTLVAEEAKAVSLKDQRVVKPSLY